MYHQTTLRKTGLSLLGLMTGFSGLAIAGSVSSPSFAPMGGASSKGSSFATSSKEASLAPAEPLVEEEKTSLWDHIKPTVDSRVRYEYGDQNGRNVSHAATLRNRLGLLLDDYRGFSFFAEYEGTLVADRDSYQAASVHGLGNNRTIIADPESHELNQLWAAYKFSDFSVKAGRQRMIHDGSRIVGNVGWRQNEQTFDAVTISNTSIPDLTLMYGYFNRVNRIFGSGPINLAGQRDFTGDSHFAHAKYTGIKNLTVTGYAYFMDLHNDAGDANSNNTYGISFDGKVPMGEDLAMTYYGEYAFQEDAFDSQLDYNTNYYHVKLGGAYKQKYTFGVGYENLGTDNGVGFKFPLGTNHKFNGFADKFLGTPADGLSDLYIYASAGLPAGFKAATAFHWFGPSNGSLSYGNEIDFVLIKKINKNFTVLGKLAYYDADEFATDTLRASIELGYKF